MEPVEMLARRNCSSILEAAKSTALEKPSTAAGRNYLVPLDLMFKCKDCSRRFPTFQALGGHRASHMKLRLTSQEAKIAGHGGEGEGFAAVTRPGRFKIHECKWCRIRFPTGQALGGHMRKHVEFGAKRKRDVVEVENLLDTLEDLDESKKKIRIVLELDLNCPPPEDELRLQLALVI